MTREEIIKQLREEGNRMLEAARILDSTTTTKNTPTTTISRVMSAEGRLRIAQAQKRRWAKLKKAA